MDFRQQLLVEYLITGRSVLRRIPWFPWSRMSSSVSLPVAVTCVPVCCLTLLSFHRMSADCSIRRRANSTAYLIWWCQLVHVSLFKVIPVQLLTTALMHVPRCWLLAILSLLTSVPSLFICSRLLLVSERFIYGACMHVNWRQNDWCLQLPLWCCFPPASRDMGQLSWCCLFEHRCSSFTSSDRCAVTCIR